MLGTGAAIGAVAPSQVWPFRKIFLPQFWMPKPWIEVSREELTATMATFNRHLSRAAYPGPLNEASIQAIELEHWMKELPNLMSGAYPALFEKQMDADMKWLWDHPIEYVPNKNPADMLCRVGSKFVDSLKVRNEDLGWDG